MTKDQEYDLIWEMISGRYITEIIKKYPDPPQYVNAMTDRGIVKYEVGKPHLFNKNAYSFSDIIVLFMSQLKNETLLQNEEIFYAATWNDLGIKKTGFMPLKDVFSKYNIKSN